MTRRLSDPSGFSLVEVLVAAVILVIGAGAAFSLIDSANRSVSANNARVGATNLGREITEYARGTDYDALQPSGLLTALRKHSSIAGTISGGAWTITRRGVTYTVTSSVCTFDDPKDGLSATPPANACPAAAPVSGAPAEINPDDFRKVTIDMTWKVRNRSGKATQSVLIVNPAGGLGPRITQFDEPDVQITADSVSWPSVAPSRLLKSTAAATVHWVADDGVSGGDATGGPTAWGFTWNFGTPFSSSAPWVRDGSYILQAQAFDARGVPGEGKIATVYVNRHPPAAVTGLNGGFNSRFGVVDMRWQRYEERDLQGYVVVRSDGTQVCPPSGTVQQGLSCTDSNPSPVASLYKVYAVDCTDLKTGTGCDRRGSAAATGTLNLAAPSWSDKPTGLTATVLDGKPTLTWTAPSTGSVQFYRIYRDSGTGLADRYDETVTSSPNYTDPEPGSTTQHKYWVTAVDQNFNESAPSDPVISPPL